MPSHKSTSKAGSPRREWSTLVEQLPQSVFDTTVLVASEVCGTPIALQAMRHRGSLRLRSAVGLPSATGAMQQHGLWMPADTTTPLVVDDLRQYPDLEESLLKLGVEEPRYYVGIPLVAGTGTLIGALAVVDTLPRKLASRRIEILTMLGTQAVAQIEFARRMYTEGQLRAEERAGHLAGSQEAERELVKLKAMMESQRTVDELTGVKNERAFRDRLLEEFERYERLQQAFSLVMVQVERIEDYQRLYGANEVSELLKRVAEWLLLRTRYCDIVARYGDYRFAVILPGTGVREVVDVMEKLRRSVVEDVPLLQGHALKIGSCSVPGRARSSQALIEECLRDLISPMRAEPEIDR